MLVSRGFPSSKSKVLAAKKAKPIRHGTAYVAVCKGEVLLQRRPRDGNRNLSAAGDAMFLGRGGEHRTHSFAKDCLGDLGPTAGGRRKRHLARK
mgnify:CR=1 FL=1